MLPLSSTKRFFHVRLALVATTLVLLLVSCPAFGEKAGTVGYDLRAVSFVLNYTLQSTTSLSKITFTVRLPQSMEYRQNILSMAFTHANSVTIFEKNGKRYARFVLNDPQPVETIAISVDAYLARFDVDAALQAPSRISPPTGTTFLSPEHLIESNAPEIVAAAKSIDGPTQLDIVHKIVSVVTDRLTVSDYQRKAQGALAAFQSGQGDCSEYATLVVALCRAKGIPARVPGGFVLNKLNEPESASHAWTEVYVSPYGWIPVDANHMDSGTGTTFNHLQNKDLYMTTDYRDPELNGNRYYSAQSTPKTPGDPNAKVEVKSSVVLTGEGV